MIAATPLAILKQAMAWIDQREALALVTLTGIEGSASRALGTQMAITASGQRIGSFSGGCLEEAIVSEAVAVLAEQCGRLVRYGTGSPYIDIRLPCGGGIDLLFTPHPSPTVLAQAIARLENRQPASLALSREGIGPEHEDFLLNLHPPLRIMTFGYGEDFTAFAQFAHHYGAVVEAFTPHRRDIEKLFGYHLQAFHLHHQQQLPPVTGDDWTAVLFLFHDPDWERALLPHLLGQTAFYLGAIGSRRKQEQRQAWLQEQGFDAETRARLKGPVGLIPGTRDPSMLALSVLADIAEAYGQACRR